MKVLDHIDIQEEALADLARRYRVREIRLFGSVLRDDFRDDSDIDVLVEYEPNAGVSLFDHFDLQEQLQTLFGRSVDLGTDLKPLIRDQVLQTSLVIFRRD